MNTSSQDLLTHIDNIIELTKPVFENGAKCAIYIDLWKKFEIDENELETLKSEFAKRDHGKPMISVFNGLIYNVTLPSPWLMNDDGFVIAPNKIEDMSCEIQDLTPKTE